jgi:hypothetical protein
MDRFSYISKRKRLLSLGSTIEKKETLGYGSSSQLKKIKDYRKRRTRLKKKKNEKIVFFMHPYFIY